MVIAGGSMVAVAVSSNVFEPKQWRVLHSLMHVGWTKVLLQYTNHDRQVARQLSDLLNSICASWPMVSRLTFGHLWC